MTLTEKTQGYSTMLGKVIWASRGPKALPGGLYWAMATTSPTNVVVAHVVVLSKLGHIFYPNRFVFWRRKSPI